MVIIGLLKGDPELCFPKEIINNGNKHITVKDAIGDLPLIVPKNRKASSKSNSKSNNIYYQYSSGKITAREYAKKLIGSL